jgi:hypothetical protein
MSQGFEGKNIFEIANAERQRRAEEAARLDAQRRKQAALEAASALRMQMLRNEIYRAGRQIVQAAQAKNITPDVVDYRKTGPWYKPKREEVPRGWTIDRDERTIFVDSSIGWDATERVEIGRIDRRTILGLDGEIYISYWGGDIKPWNRPSLAYMGICPNDDRHLTRVDIESDHNFKVIQKGLIQFVIDNNLDTHE